MALIAILLLFSSLTVGSGWAQDATPDGPVYIVQAGDSLWDIAARFGLSLTELTTANNITDANQISVGSQLVIPGLEGVQGVLVTEQVAFGDSLRGLSRRYGVPVEMLARLNHLTSPGELFAGQTLIIPQSDAEAAGEAPPYGRALLAPEQSLLELAALQGANPWSLAQTNGMASPSLALPGDVLQVPGGGSGAQADEGRLPSALPDAIYQVQLRPEILVQGQAAEIAVQGEPGMSLSGALADRSIQFFQDSDGRYAALIGLHAMMEPGLYPLELDGTLANGAQFSFTQAVFVKDGGYPFDPVLVVSPETIDPAVTKPEDAQWTALAQPVTPERLWQGPFQSPTPEIYSDCWPSLFGSRRSYNGSPYDYFHTGLDFCGGVGTEILAPAAGKVIFAGPMTVRGNATMIDHGWGVYTGYMHQSEIDVQAGDIVQPGQVIGLVGGTGRVTGPHLHFEMWVGGVQVDPLSWLEQTFP